jgi:hypothetical protein
MVRALPHESHPVHRRRRGRGEGAPRECQPTGPPLWDYGWMLEEFRLSLLAPDIPTELKVSEKRLAEGF